MVQGNVVSVGSKYKHFKGGEYVVLSIGRDSRTCEEVVVYQGQYNSIEFGDKPIWVRTLKDFTSDKVFEDGRRVPRFMLL